VICGSDLLMIYSRSFSFSLDGVLHHCLFSKIGVNGVLDLWSRVLNFWWGLGISVVGLIII
jgi:hypothetical protein